MFNSFLQKKTESIMLVFLMIREIRIHVFLLSVVQSYQILEASGSNQICLWQKFIGICVNFFPENRISIEKIL